VPCGLVFEGTRFSISPSIRRVSPGRTGPIQRETAFQRIAFGIGRAGVNIDHRPSSNRRRHQYTAPPSGNCGGSSLASCPRARAGAPFEDDLLLPRLKEGRPSRQDVAFGPLGLLGQSMEVLEVLIHLRKTRPRLREERT
jgi:hypothetical protein